jgi:zinc protease
LPRRKSRPSTTALRVVVSPRRGLPIVTTELVVRSGSETDPAPLAGLADITATLLTKGTAKHTAPQIAEAAEALGGTLDSGAGWYRSTVAMTVTKPNAPAALALIAEVARTPRFAQAELERARRLAVDGLSVALRDPGKLAGMAADRAAFGEVRSAIPRTGRKRP